MCLAVVVRESIKLGQLSFGDVCVWQIIININIFGMTVILQVEHAQPSECHGKCEYRGSNQVISVEEGMCASGGEIMHQMDSNIISIKQLAGLDFQLGTYDRLLMFEYGNLPLISPSWDDSYIANRTCIAIQMSW